MRFFCPFMAGACSITATATEGAYVSTWTGILGLKGSQDFPDLAGGDDDTYTLSVDAVGRVSLSRTRAITDISCDFVVTVQPPVGLIAAQVVDVQTHDAANDFSGPVTGQSDGADTNNPLGIASPYYSPSTSTNQPAPTTSSGLHVQALFE